MKRIVSNCKSGSVVSLARLLSFVLFSLLFGTQCANPSPEELASLAAQGYYTHLAAGEYELFMEGRVGNDSLPENYREQLLEAFKQFWAQQERAHKGIREVRVSSAKIDSTQHFVNVFLVLCYGDSLDEEIVVPMVEHAGKWQMK